MVDQHSVTGDDIDQAHEAVALQREYEFDYCGCCAEVRRVCVCSLGPCDTFNEFMNRKDYQHCVHPEGSTPPPHVEEANR